eukprot:CAMPEP_0178910478 /NCGR_PEP_ID=MMETSP0786-20121207/9119_1 /TAXON_ID=186022 /ORGANISM="Thalassionema frauenfeldii, Strain CCMP 1798" /LENGTH=295 /DNA_ID=CAMNT_0020582733 /DNA_START=93 /DNA_END=980 /DNA_ORIENTATION=+
MSCTDPSFFGQKKPLEYRISPDVLIKITTDAPRFVLGYWSIRGQPLRMMLSASRVPHWVAMYHVKEVQPEGWDKESWYKDKAWMSEEYNPFANLPFLIDTQTKIIICQTNAIYSYLGKELNMLGSNKIEAAKCEELLCEIYDLRNVMVGFAYNKSVSGDTAKKCLKSGIIHFQKFERHLQNYTGRSKGFLVGKRLTAPDFHLFEMYFQFDSLSKYYKIDDIALEKILPLLAENFQTFQSLKENQMYLNSSDLYTNLPFNNPYALFGSDSVTNGIYQRGKGVTKEIGTILLEFDRK